MADRELDKEFWNKDMTKVHERRGWFANLSLPRKLIYLWLVLFVMACCFFIGFQVVCAMQPAPEEYHYVTAADLVDEDVVGGGEVAELEGTEVVLIVGCDMRPGETVARTDTIMLGFVNWDRGEISILSIPRDSYVQIPGTSTKTKINAAFYSGGIERTRETVEYLTGIAIDHYIIVDFQGFRDTVDALGGVEVDVDVRMYKPSENIDIQPGLQVLNGYDALGYCRYRGYENADLGRIEHQQNFMLALKDELLQLSTIMKIPDLVSIAIANITTDISFSDAVVMATNGFDLDLDNIKMYTLPGVSMYIKTYNQWLSYQIVPEAETIALLDEITHGQLDYEPHIITDGGEGRFSVPSEGETPEEDAPEEVLLPSDNTDPGVVDPGVADPGATEPQPVDPGTTEPQPVDPGTTEPQPVDPGVADPGAGDDTDVWDIPEP